jgi:gas vesicle protein
MSKKQDIKPINTNEEPKPNDLWGILLGAIIGAIIQVLFANTIAKNEVKK